MSRGQYRTCCMKERLFIKISRRDGLKCRQIHLKLLELYVHDAFPYSGVCHWSRQLLMSRESVEDARRTRQSPDFSVQLRIQSALEEIPLAFVRCSAEATQTPATILFCVLTKALGLGFCHSRSAPHLVSDDQKANRA
jgi:hypothetical protein